MDKIFENKEVGDFFNGKIVAIKVDAEKGEGIELSKKLNVSGFPTMIYFDSEGKELKRLSGATPNAQFFINLTKLAINSKDGESAFATMMEQYKRGYRNLNFISDMIGIGAVEANLMPRDSEEQRETFTKVSELVHWYFAAKRPEEMINPKDFALIAMYLDGPSNGHPLVELVYTNWKAFENAGVPIDDIMLFVARTNNQSIHDSYQKGNTLYRQYLEQTIGRLKPIYDAAGNDAQDSYTVMKYVGDAGYALYAERDFQKYWDINQKYFNYEKAKGDLKSFSYTTSAGNLLALLKEGEVLSTKLLKSIIAHLKAGDKAFPDNRQIIITMGDTYTKLGDNKRAIACYEKVKVLAKGQRGEDYFIKSMNEKIAKLK